MTNTNQNNPETVKWMSVLAYFGILFFLPLAVVPNSEEGKFHANQGLTLLLTIIAISIVGSILGIIPIIGILGVLIVTLGNIGCFVLAIMGIINALNMEQKKLPIIGDYTFLK